MLTGDFIQVNTSTNKSTNNREAEILYYKYRYLQCLKHRKKFFLDIYDMILVDLTGQANIHLGIIFGNFHPKSNSSSTCSE